MCDISALCTEPVQRSGVPLKHIKGGDSASTHRDIIPDRQARQGIEPRDLRTESHQSAPARAAGPEGQSMQRTTQELASTSDNQSQLLMPQASCRAV